MADANAGPLSLTLPSVSRAVSTPGSRSSATSRLSGQKLWTIRRSLGRPLSSTTSITRFAYAGEESKSESVGTFLSSRFTNAPSSRGEASTCASVGIDSVGWAICAVGRPPPGLPRTSSLQPTSSATIVSRTSPAHVVVRSSVGSWMTTGTPSAVSLASSSSQ